ncbi:MAG: glycosyltransferase family 39 protein [Bacteroidia bacterium]|nr:glycosyltransferase family 39 protein [Bacteroidia bacterium]
MEAFQRFIRVHNFSLAFFGMALIYFLNLFLDVMDVDAAQYASISREMLESGRFLQVYHRGLDYLDKPPLLFWLSAISFKLFGINNFAFKLPAVLVVVLGIFSTYQLSKLWYDDKTGKIAALILGYSQAVFLMTNDIRMDGMLMGWVIFTIWQFSLFLKKNRFVNLLLASLGLGLSMMTKGPLGLIIPAAAFTAHFAIKGQWKNFLKWEWLVALVIALATLAPMLWGLYHQFDLQPEKEVYGLSGPSGVKFFFWTQSFGRITGDIYWDNGAPWHFFLGTILWDFSPWILLLIPAIVLLIKTFASPKILNKNYPEFLSIGGFVLVFIMLSMSNYKLPHYIFPLLPFAAMLSARYLSLANTKFLHGLCKGQFVFLHLFYLAMAVYFVQVFSGDLVWIAFLIVSYLFFCSVKLFSEKTSNKFLNTSLVAAFTLNLILSLHFYPKLLEYQASNQVGRMAENTKKEWDEFHSLYHISHSLDFYSRRTNVFRFPEYLVETDSGSWIYTGKRGKAEIDSLAPGKFMVIDTFKVYKISNLSLEFLNKNTRDSATKELYLLEKLE